MRSRAQPCVTRDQAFAVAAELPEHMARALLKHSLGLLAWDAPERIATFLRGA